MAEPIQRHPQKIEFVSRPIGATRADLAVLQKIEFVNRGIVATGADSGGSSENRVRKPADRGGHGVPPVQCLSLLSGADNAAVTDPKIESGPSTFRCPSAFQPSNLLAF
jgi:hypothetical protein